MTFPFNVYRPADYERDCRYETDWLVLVLRLCRRRWLYPSGIATSVIARMLQERVWRLRN